MANKCENCTEKCPQAERAHQTALGRMYATKEFTTLLKKVECGELVEVVRCKDCVHYVNLLGSGSDYRCSIFSGCYDRPYPTNADDFCSYGERREGE